MGALALASTAARDLPDYLPARMVNEFVYCPRLFWYEWVESVFAESADQSGTGVIGGRVHHCAHCLAWRAALIFRQYTGLLQQSARSVKISNSRKA